MFLLYTDYAQLYNTIQQEKQSMMTQVEGGFMFQEKYCKNSCEKSSLPRNIDECHCDEQCVDFGDCCLDYWER